MILNNLKKKILKQIASKIPTLIKQCPVNYKRKIVFLLSHIN